MSDVVPAPVLALAAENADLGDQPAAAQDTLVPAAIDAGNMHAVVGAMRPKRSAWREEAKRATLSAGIDHDWEPLRNLIAPPSVDALPDSQNLFRPAGS